MCDRRSLFCLQIGERNFFQFQLLATSPVKQDKFSRLRYFEFRFAGK